MSSLSEVLKRMELHVKQREQSSDILPMQPLGSTSGGGKLTTVSYHQSLQTSQKAKESLPTNTSEQDLTNTSPAARSEEIADMVSVCFKALDTYGRSPDQMQATIKLFCMVLEGQPVDKVRAAFRQWVMRNSKFPTPADIMNIVEPPVEEWKPDWAVYVSLTKRIQNDGYYPLSDERAFLQRCRDWTIRRAVGDEPAEQEARQLMITKQEDL